jgi:hypothetical protein
MGEHSSDAHNASDTDAEQLPPVPNAERRRIVGLKRTSSQTAGPSLLCLVVSFLDSCVQLYLRLLLRR